MGRHAELYVVAIVGGKASKLGFDAEYNPANSPPNSIDEHGQTIARLQRTRVDGMTVQKIKLKQPSTCIARGI